MNAERLDASNSTSRSPETRRAGAVTAVGKQEPRRAEFAAAMRRNGSALLDGAIDDESLSLDGEPILLQGQAGATVLEQGGVLAHVDMPCQPVASSMFGASLSASSGRPVARGSVPFAVPVFDATTSAKKRVSQSLSRIGTSDRAEVGGDLARGLVDELVRCLHVGEQRKAQRAFVHLVLKGQVCEGTQVVLQREGHQVRVVVAVPSLESYLAMRERADELQRAVAAALPDCNVEVSLDMSNGRSESNRRSRA